MEGTQICSETVWEIEVSKEELFGVDIQTGLRQHVDYISSNDNGTTLMFSFVECISQCPCGKTSLSLHRSNTVNDI